MVDDNVQGSVRGAVIEKVLERAAELSEAKVRYAQEFLLAKAQRREGNPISDKTAEMMAVIATKGELDYLEAKLLVWYNTLENIK